MDNLLGTMNGKEMGGDLKLKRDMQRGKKMYADERVRLAPICEGPNSE